MAGLMLTPEMAAQLGVNPDGSPATGVGSVTQPAIPNPTPTATGKGPNNQGGFGMIRDATQRRASGKGSTPPSYDPTATRNPAVPAGAPSPFTQDPMASRGVQSMGVAQPFYMANAAGLAQPQMAGQAAYMRQMGALGQAPMAQSPTVSPLPPAQFPAMPPTQTFGGPQPATGKGPGSGQPGQPSPPPATGKLPQPPGSIAGGGGSGGGGGYMPPGTPETGGGYPSRPEPDQYQAAVMPTTTEYSPQNPISGGGGMAAQPEGPVMEKQAGGSTYGFDSSEVEDARSEMIRRAIDAAAGVGPKS